MIAKLIGFLKNDFMSKVMLSCNFVGIYYLIATFNESFMISKILIVLALAFNTLAVIQLYLTKAAIKYEHILLYPIILFTSLIVVVSLLSYNKATSIQDFVDSYLYNILDVLVAVILIYSSLIATVSFSVAVAVSTQFVQPIKNIEIITGNRPDLVQYQVMKRHLSVLRLNDFKFCTDGFIFKDTIISYQSIYNYMLDQQVKFDNLTNEDFTIMHMIKI